MMKHITDEGFLRVDTLVGWDLDVLRVQRVTVHTDANGDGPRSDGASEGGVESTGDLTGVIGSDPTHGKDGDEAFSVEDVTIDLGLPAEEVASRVSVGDLVSTAQTTERVGHNISGKALDDRVCLFALLEAAKRVEDPDVTIHFCATVQEELGVRGAPALGADLDPNLAVALDVTVANEGRSDDRAAFLNQLFRGAVPAASEASEAPDDEKGGVVSKVFSTHHR